MNNNTTTPEHLINALSLFREKHPDWTIFNRVVESKGFDFCYFECRIINSEGTVIASATTPVTLCMDDKGFLKLYNTHQDECTFRTIQLVNPIFTKIKTT